MAIPAEMILEEQRNKVTRQEAEFNGVRGRATAVSSAAGLVAAVLAPHFYSSGDIASVVALGVTVGIIGMGVWIAYPRTWGYGAGLDEVIAWEADHGTDPAAPAMVARHLTTTLDEVLDVNSGVLDDLNLWFGIQCGLFALQLVAWGIGIGLH